MSYPLWATPERRRQLVRLWLSYGNRCLQGHPACLDLSHYWREQDKAEVVGCEVTLPISDREGTVVGSYLSFGYKRVVITEMELQDLYTAMSEDAIAEWKQEDRVERSIAWKLEERRLHAAPLKKLWRRGDGYDAIARDIYLAERPTFRVLAVGVNSFSQQRVAKVAITALEKVIWVNISGVKLSKNKLRKLFRRGDVPEEIYEVIEQRIRCYL